jgi:hypothetical protein
MIGAEDDDIVRLRDLFYIDKDKDKTIRDGLKPSVTDKIKTKCFNCGGQLIHDINLVCSKCGQVQDSMPEFVVSYEDMPKKSNAYVRRVHFMRILKRIQNKRRTEIEYDTPNIETDIYDGTTINKLKKMVKDYRINCYYLIERITNKPYIHLTYKQQESILALYIKISHIWDFVLTKDEKLGRKNYLNNYFVLKQICRILGYDDIVDKIHDLLGKSIREKHMKLWKNIMKYLNIWQVHHQVKS